jgi:hypothetical protein
MEFLKESAINGISFDGYDEYLPGEEEQFAEFAESDDNINSTTQPQPEESEEEIKSPRTWEGFPLTTQWSSQSGITNTIKKTNPFYYDSKTKKSMNISSAPDFNPSVRRDLPLFDF